MFGIFLAYWAIYLGDAIYIVFAREFARDAALAILIIVLLGDAIIVAIIVALVCWIVSTVVFLSKDLAEEFPPEYRDTFAYGSFVVSGLLYGTFAGPFSNHGLNPMHWISGWNFIVFLAAIPVWLSVWKLLSDLVKSAQGTLSHH